MDSQQTGNEVFPQLKKILYYNTFFGQEDFYYGFGHHHFVEGCDVSNCYATKNRSLLCKLIFGLFN